MEVARRELFLPMPEGNYLAEETLLCEETPSIPALEWENLQEAVKRRTRFT